MTSLAEQQTVFLRAILDEGAPLPEGWGNSHAEGLAVYRGNHRSAIMGALAETFERTALCVGEQAFAQASINHAIAHPPSGWTIDEAGLGFEQTCAALFSDRPEVAELAWLEWVMLGLATAPDCEPLSPQDFAQAAAAFRMRIGAKCALACNRALPHGWSGTIWRRCGGCWVVPNGPISACRSRNAA